MKTLVFEDDEGTQILVTIFDEDGGADRGVTSERMDVAARPYKGAVWGPPLRLVMVDERNV